MSDTTVNPAWKPLLDLLPPDVQAQAVPLLKEYDSKYAAEQEKNKAFEPYAKLAEAKVPVERIAESLQFTDELTRDPKGTLAKVNEAWNLGFVPEDQIPPSSNEPDPLEEFDDMDDISKHPLMKQMMDQMTKIQETFEQQQMTQQEREELAAFNAEVDGLLADDANKNVPRELVMAYMAQGVDGPDAVTRVKSFLASGVEVPNNTPDTPPQLNLLGGAGGVGSGLPNGAIDVGHNVKSGKIEDLVVTMLEQQAQANAQG